jgi:hypothetical protein
MTIDHVKIARIQSLAASLDTFPDPGRRVVEHTSGDPTDLGQDEVLFSAVMFTNMVGRESSAKNFFGWTVIW